MEKKFAAVQFTQSTSNKKLVIANKYVPHALYVQNKAIVESLGGEILKGVGGFQAEFAKVKDAKEFVSKAICEISAEEYAASRKVEAQPKKNIKAKANAKPTGKKVETKANHIRKSKKDAEVEVAPVEVKITPTQKKVIDDLNVSLWNRVAAAYDRANGGTGVVTFDGLGKSKEELKAFVPAGMASLKKSKKWQKAIDADVTEEMLG